MRILKFQLAVSCIFVTITAVQAPALADQFNLDRTIMRDTVPARKDDNAGTVNRFAEIYGSRQKPKIAVFVNRALSDDVREWRTERRDVMSADSVTSTSGTPLHYREDSVNGPLAISRQEYNGVKEARNNTSESYLWSFEDGFMQPFLQAGANLVDRATIMRLVSQKADQGLKSDAIETKKTEMSALLDYADVYVEILITRSPSAPTGYEFRAAAKEVKTGRILANATSLNWDISKERPKKVITTPAGYKVVNDNSMLKAQTVSRDLALDLMNGLISCWTHY